ncbi:sensor histidine kinase [Luteimonas sp. BDR2-5]|uniref:sensor histidine kinase n=1 Tax=Proluteimonas luteida TaxID=2878685 RepID=UPI001E2FB21D|nr:sensor histidine kinase [Luteimonas sp. BDR2-5]MCD9028352.1 sensor histidine kinase [Luteimonas sp. BDR2-5]
MSGRRALSLRVRLWLAGAAGVAIAALIAGSLLGTMFERYGQRALDQRLDDDFATLAGLLEAAPDGSWQLRRAPADERYARVFSGWYWRIGEGEGARQSRSLWDDELGIDAQVAPGPALWTQATGPRGQQLRVRVQQLRLPGVAVPVPVLVAADRGDVIAGTREFRRLAMLAFAGAAATLLALLAWQVEWGLRPLRRMRGILARVRNGDDVRFGDDCWPAEAAPLAQQIDELLDEHGRRVERARHAAADLAHALKTPLAVLSAEAQQPGPEIAAIVAGQVRRMQAEVERRLVGGFATDARRRTPVAPVADALAALFARAGDGRVTVGVEVTPDLVFAGAREDLEEMLGNLVDNAVKWASARVRVHAWRTGGRLWIAVDDDGPGMRPDALAEAVQRGTRLDTRVAGHGLGLSIVDDIASGYDGRLQLANLDPGFRAALDLPAGDPPPTS